MFPSNPGHCSICSVHKETEAWARGTCWCFLTGNRRQRWDMNHGLGIQSPRASSVHQAPAPSLCHDWSPRRRAEEAGHAWFFCPTCSPDLVWQLLTLPSTGRPEWKTVWVGPGRGQNSMELLGLGGVKGRAQVHREGGQGRDREGGPAMEEKHRGDMHAP